MKIYLVVDEEAQLIGNPENKEIDEDSWYNTNVVSIYRTLDVAIEALEANGYKLNIGYTRKDKRPGYTAQVSNTYWYDYDNGYISCSWVEEHEVIEQVDFVFDKDFMAGKCCGNCKYFIDDDYVFGDNCTVFNLASYCCHENVDRVRREYDDACKYFILDNCPEINYDAYVNNKQIVNLLTEQTASETRSEYV